MCCGNHLSQWQMITQMSKSLEVDIVWGVHKRAQQGVSAKLESYIYRMYIVHATSSCLPHFLLKTMSYASPPVQETTSPRRCQLWTLQAHLPRQPSFLQHVLWWCCNPPGIPSSTMEILLFNSVFHDGVAPVSVSTLKLPLGVIGVVTLKPRASPILSVCI